MSNVEMKMTVIFPNGEVGTVPKDILDDSIRGKRIIAFLRSSGWVQIDRDPTRKTLRPSTNSEEMDGDTTDTPNPQDT
jgi:hypothetical protein